MSDDATSRSTKDEPSTAPPGAPRRVYLVPYPKIVFLYPSFLAALVIAITLTFFSTSAVGPDDTVAVVCSLLFLGIMAMNLVVLSFDFPRATSLTLFFFIAALILAGAVLFIMRPGLLPAVGQWLGGVKPVANATFYWIVSGLFALLFVVVMIVVRFDYWEVRPNELLHHHGILSDLKRFSAPHLRIDKEINDVFEYLLLRSGRLILQPSGERRAIVLDNVPFISHKEEQITKMLGALQVQLRHEEH
jgi:hypothetical protein